MIEDYYYLFANTFGDHFQLFNRHGQPVMKTITMSRDAGALPCVALSLRELV